MHILDLSIVFDQIVDIFMEFVLQCESVAVEIIGWSVHGTGGSFDCYVKNVYLLNNKRMQHIRSTGRKRA